MRFLPFYSISPRHNNAWLSDNCSLAITSRHRTIVQRTKKFRSRGTVQNLRSVHMKMTNRVEF